jgi:biopolymer transport protein ExbB
MYEIVLAGGWVMWPILACSVVALGIILERLWILRERRVVPDNLVGEIWRLYRGGKLSPGQIKHIRDGSPLGRILAAGLANLKHSREVMKEAIEDVGRHVVHDLERNLNILGTIAAVSPLLGLLGTVLGMIEVFTVITAGGVGKPTELAGGIGTALITTAAGLFVAIPAMLFHSYFSGKVEQLVILMEGEALKLVEVMHGEREQEGE